MLRALVPTVADPAGRARTVPGARILMAGAAAGTLALAIALPGRAGAAQGDQIYPQVGTRSYDVRHYAIELGYDPEENRLLAGTRTTIRARAKERLSRVKLDFRRLDVTAVKVDGRPAGFAMRDARPRLGGGPRVSQPGKLIIKPARAIKRGARFRVTVSYEGRPKTMLGPDGAPIGWIRACHGDECDGSYTVNEPIGAQSWFPCNDRPGDKATIATEVTVPDGYTAIGTGELAGSSAGPGGRTWIWREDEPVATYLASATVGRFLLDEDSIGDGRGGRLPVLVAIDAAATPGAIAAVRRSASRISALMRFLRARLGRYPFGSTGLVADWVPRVGYALENQTLPHFGGDREGPGVSTVLLAHELAHQWMGNAVTPRAWSQIWFSEGWATWLERRWAANNDHGTGPGDLLHEALAMPRSAWRIAPAARRRSPALLFTSFATYERPAAMLEGYRRIAGTKALWRLARRLSREHRYRNIGEKRFVREALNSAGARGGHRHRLRRYFRQWLHRRARPTLTPAAFRRR